MELITVSGTEYMVGCAASYDSSSYMYGFFIMDTSTYAYTAYDNSGSSSYQCMRVLFDITTLDITIYY